jgi:adenylate cyclase
LIVFAVLSAFQAFVYVVTRISASESLHKEKSQHLRQAFSRYVPASVAEALADSGEEIKLGGDEREISVLFCDIRGFTAWSETVEAEVVIEQLNALLRGLSASVLETGGTLDKYTGDGLMAFWGAPLAQPDHADRALQAAINMLGRLDECNAERAKQGLKPFAIGIGIHSGTAVVGNIGHEDRLDYTAIGDTVNTAARLEAATKEVGSVLVFSDRTYSELLPTRQRLCRSAGDVTVKGKAEPISVYALEEGSSDELADRWDAAFMTPDERAA